MKTQDAMLYFHAGMIEDALGNDNAARGYLNQALTINPEFHPSQPLEARKVLQGIGR